MHNAAQAEYDRLAALVSCRALKSPGTIQCASGVPRFDDRAKISSSAARSCRSLLRNSISLRSNFAISFSAARMN
jgi:hypothetical protein